ncbi:MAG: homocysteine S-methyltransferase family protein [Gammaproteobacteria bacterium]|nr:homocysteine S-methyltransferase family protein [Gammaproteobacteria bacterium]
MIGHRHDLPQLHGGLFLTEGGIGTTLIHHDGVEIPHFATFALLATPEGTAHLRRAFRPYAENARRFHAGLIVDSNTWRGSRDWGEKLGYSRAGLAAANRAAIALLEELRGEYETSEAPFVISACMGPRGSAYSASAAQSVDAAEHYHREQVETLAATTADVLSAMTMTHPDEAAGIVRAARAARMPAVVSFTVETDGRLVSGYTVAEAIARVDGATDGYASYFMLNCAHADHFERALADDGAWIARLHGLRSNSSTKSHAELDEATTLDEGDPDALGLQYRSLAARYPHMNVLGGCCGTDVRHARCIAERCVDLFSR